MRLSHGSGHPPTHDRASIPADEPEDYDGPRSEEAFVEFLNEKCGTQRAPGGGLTELAGRLPEFDTLASQFVAAAGEARDAIYKDASALAASVGPTASHYVRVMEKVVNGSEEYLEKETKRCVTRQSRVSSKCVLTGKPMCTD